MDVGKTSSNPALTRQLEETGADRAAALAEARRRAGAAQIEAEAAARERRAAAIVETREALAEALGANTRIAIARSKTNPVFVYRAIDIESGEVVQEWPPERFADFVNGLRPGAGDDLAGFLVDGKA
ncbi:MAG: hypothetical protein AB7P23_02005 [Amphiplicatus sp.]